jgi:flavin-dependent dehydrogenase
MGAGAGRLDGVPQWGRVVASKHAEVIVVGAGAAGLMTALELAGQGLHCLLVEAQAEEGWGHRFFVDIDSGAILNGQLPGPSNAAIVFHGDGGADVLAPSGITGFHVQPLPVHTLRLWVYEKQLLEEARARGVNVQMGSKVTSFARVPGDKVGVHMHTRTGPREILCDLLVLATGVSFEMERELYAHFGIRRRIADRELMLAQHESWGVDPRKAAAAALPSPAGCATHFLGRGGPFSTLSLWLAADRKSAALLAGSFPCDGHPAPDEMLVDLRQQLRIFTRRSTCGGGLIPVRRPVEMLAGRGVALVGQAAAQVFPLTASGVVLAARAARSLASAAREYCREGRRPESLWKYNREYQASSGALQAGAEVLVRHVRRADASGQWHERIMRAGLAGPRDFVRSLQAASLVPSLPELPGKAAGLLKGGLASIGLSAAMLRSVAVSQAWASLYPEEPDSAAVRRFAGLMARMMGK